METATPGIKSTTDGWLNRCMQAKPDPKATPSRAVALVPGLPCSLMGKAPAITMADIADFGINSGPDNGLITKTFEALYGQNSIDIIPWHCPGNA